MRIAAINTTADRRRAPSSIMLGILDGVVEHGLGETLALFGRGAFEGDSRVESMRVTGASEAVAHAALARFNDSEGLHSSRATRRLIDKLEQWHPDIVHIHNLHGHYLNYKILFEYLSKSKVQVVITLHDCWLYTGHCTLYSHTSCRRCMASGNTSVGKCACRGEYPATFISRVDRNLRLKERLIGAIDNLTLVAVSPWSASELQSSIFAGRKIVTIENGVDCEIFRPSSVKVPGMILAVANRWDSRKGLDDLLALKPLLRADERIVVVGKTDGRLPSWVDNRGIVSDPAELAGLYSQASVTVVPSQGESFGMVPVESLACGTPVVVNNAPAMPQVLGDGNGVVGVVTVTSSPSQLRDAIDRASQYKSSACRSYALNRFPSTRMVEKYLDLYNAKGMPISKPALLPHA